MRIWVCEFAGGFIPNTEVVAVKPPDKEALDVLKLPAFSHPNQRRRSLVSIDANVLSLDVLINRPIFTSNVPEFN